MKFGFMSKNYNFLISLLFIKLNKKYKKNVKFN